MARYLLDTNIFTFLATDEEDRITDDVRAIPDRAAGYGGDADDG